MAPNILDDLRIVNYESPAWSRLKESTADLDLLWVGQPRYAWTLELTFRVFRNCFIILWCILMFTPGLLIPSEPLENTSLFSWLMAGGILIGAVFYTVRSTYIYWYKRRHTYYAISETRLWVALPDELFSVLLGKAEKVDLISNNGQYGTLHFEFDQRTVPVPSFVDDDSESFVWYLKFDGIEEAYPFFQRIRHLHSTQKIDIDQT